MSERHYALMGVIGPLIALIFIGISIASAPWFSWSKNALSDLGNSIKSRSAIYFYFGLTLAGFLIIIYSITIFRKYARYTSICLSTSAFFLQLVSVFNEVYSSLHYTISVLFFISLGVATITYSLEKKSSLAVLAFITSLSSWVLLWAGAYNVGIAVPEIVSSIAF